MNDSRVLITGVDGFTGRYLVPELTRLGYEVHGVVRGPQTPALAGVAASHVADLGDAAALARVVDAVRPARVVHLAAIAFVAHGDVDAIYRTNLLGTRNLLEALAGAARSPDAVLLASSANVYGNGLGGVLEESTAPDPANDYAVSKLAMEHVARLYATRLPLVVTRPFNYTGVGQTEDFLIPKIVSHVRRRAPVIELGNLEVERDFSDVRFVAQAYARLLQAPAAIGRTFNVCSGQARSLDDLIARIRRLSGHDFEVRVNPAFVRANEVRTLVGSRARLDAVVGALPAIAIDDTLQWMLGEPAAP